MTFGYNYTYTDYCIRSENKYSMIRQFVGQGIWMEIPCILLLLLPEKILK